METATKSVEGPATSIAFDFVPETLPTCPDGSGDLWWDDASYSRYQSWDPYYPEDDLFVLGMTLPSRRYPSCPPEAGALELVSPDYSDQKPVEVEACDEEVLF